MLQQNSTHCTEYNIVKKTDSPPISRIDYSNIHTSSTCPIYINTRITLAPIHKPHMNSEWTIHILFQLDYFAGAEPGRIIYVNQIIPSRGIPPFWLQSPPAGKKYIRQASGCSCCFDERKTDGTDLPTKMIKISPFPTHQRHLLNYFKMSFGKLMSRLL